MAEPNDGPERVVLSGGAVLRSGGGTFSERGPAGAGGEPGSARFLSGRPGEPV